MLVVLKMISRKEECFIHIDFLSREEHPAELHLHELLKTNLRKDDLQDTMINRLCDLER